MRRWGHRAGLAPPALLFALALTLPLLQCGGGTGSSANDDIAPPQRLDPGDGGDEADAPSPRDAAAADARGFPDAGGPACDPLKPFGAPLRLTEFDSASTRSTPRLSADELTVYFTTAGKGNGSDLSSAVRASTSAPFGGEKVLAQSTAANENDPSVAADHLSLWFHSGRNGSADLFMASRATTAVPFGVAGSLPVVNQPMTNEVQPYFRQATNELWFASDRLAAGSFDLYVAPRVAASFGAPVRVAELSSPGQEQHPQISEDGKTLIFSSDRAGGKGKLDVWMARRPTGVGLFSAPAPLTELNSPNVDQAGWLSADGCRIWFSSGRTSNDALQVLFTATRPR